LKEFLFCLQSLSGSDRVDGDGELVEDDKAAEEDGNGDASQHQVPTGVGSVVLLNSDGEVLGGSGNNNVGNSDIVLAVISETSAIATSAASSVVGEGTSDSQESQEADNHGDQDQQGNSEENNAENVHSQSEQQTVAERISEREQQEDGNETREDQSDQNESLHKLEDGPDGRRGVVLGEGVDFSGDGRLEGSGNSGKIVARAGVVQSNNGGRSR